MTCCSGSPAGGGTARVDDRTVFAAIVFVLTTGCAWRHMPPNFALSHQTMHRRFTEWSMAGRQATLHRAVLDRLGGAGAIDWSRAIAEVDHQVRSAAGGVP
jgi:transposase